MFAAFRGHEPWGNILQTLARLRVLSGDDRYLVAAEQIADRLLLDPEQAVTRINYQDHGCELTPGLTELFVVESKLGRAQSGRVSKGRCNVCWTRYWPMRLIRQLDSSASSHSRTATGSSPRTPGAMCSSATRISIGLVAPVATRPRWKNRFAGCSIVVLTLTGTAARSGPVRSVQTTGAIRTRA